jgi:hypothetical protein
MKLLWSAGDFSEAHLIKQELEAVGIAASVQEDQPSLNLWPVSEPVTGARVFVLDDDLPRAKKLLADYLERTMPDAQAEDWTCRACGEVVEGHFGECWYCGAERQDEHTNESD